MPNTTTTGSFAARVAEQAASMRPLRFALTVLAVPFYVLGLAAGAVFVAALWAAGAIKVGIADVRARLAPAAPAPDELPRPTDDEGIE